MTSPMPVAKGSSFLCVPNPWPQSPENARKLLVEVALCRDRAEAQMSGSMCLTWRQDFYLYLK